MEPVHRITVPVIHCRTIAPSRYIPGTANAKVTRFCNAASSARSKATIRAQLRPFVGSASHIMTLLWVDQRKTAKCECKPFAGGTRVPSDRIQSFLVRCTHIMPGIQASVQRMYRRHHTPAGSPDDPPLSAPLIDRSSSVANGEKRGTKKMERIKYS